MMNSVDASSFMVEWFRQLCVDANGCDSVRWFDNRTAGQMLLETLTDTSNELSCSAFLAAHLRRFGLDRLGSHGHFWVRSEWDKFDLSYGLATAAFKDWNVAWSSRLTGDIGTIEVKVLYGHYPPSKVLAKVAELANQLATRRHQVRGWRGVSGESRSVRDAYGYHGLLLLARQGETAIDTINSMCQGVRLTSVVDWEPLGTLTRDDLRRLWPRSDIHTNWHLLGKVVANAG